MSYSGGVISAPVAITDVKAVLQESSYDLATLCTSGKINKWSKYKPVRHDTLAGITAQQQKNAHYGLMFSTINTEDEYEALVDAGEAEDAWSYEVGNDYGKPIGGSDSPYRLGDFKGYDHYQSAPLENMSEDDQEIDVADWGDQAKVTFKCGIADPTDDRLIDLSGILPDVGDYYYFVMAYSSGGSLVAWEGVGPIINEGTLVAGNYFNTIQVNNAQSGDYKVYHMICRGEVDSTGTIRPQDTFIPFPNYNKTTFHFNRVAPAYVLEAYIGFGDIYGGQMTGSTLLTGGQTISAGGYRTVWITLKIKARRTIRGFDASSLSIGFGNYFSASCDPTTYEGPTIIEEGGEYEVSAGFDGVLSGISLPTESAQFGVGTDGNEIEGASWDSIIITD